MRLFIMKDHRGRGLQASVKNQGALMWTASCMVGALSGDACGKNTSCVLRLGSGNFSRFLGNISAFLNALRVLVRSLPLACPHAQGEHGPI